MHSLSFTRAASSLADALGGALADLERALPGAVVVFITIEQVIDHPPRLSYDSPVIEISDGMIRARRTEL